MRPAARGCGRSEARGRSPLARPRRFPASARRAQSSPWIRRHPASVSHVATVLRYRDLAEVAVDVERSPGTLVRQKIGRALGSGKDFATHYAVDVNRGTGSATGHAACRFCGAPLELTRRRPRDVAALRELPAAPSRSSAMEPFYPLHVFACERCWLVQLAAFVAPEEIFTEYAYFSAYSTAWVEHARAYVEMIRARLELGAGRPRRRARVERRLPAPALRRDRRPGPRHRSGGERRARPRRSAACRRSSRSSAARPREQLVDGGKSASLIVGNNVLAQVPGPQRLRRRASQILLRDGGTATFEFPHLLRLLEGLQYDTIYHEHFSYFSLATIGEILAAHGLEVYDVEELWTHGGSLRVYAQHAGGPHARADGRREPARARGRRGPASPERYDGFAEEREGVEARAPRAPDPAPPGGKARRRLRRPRQGEHAPQLLRDPHGSPRLHGRPQPVQARALHPGTHIPIYPPERIAETRPDYILVLPWNLIDEIVAQLAYVAEWGGAADRPDPARDRSSSPDDGAHELSLRAELERRHEGRHLLRRHGRPHGRGDPADPEADDPDRQPARSSGTS